MSGILYTIEKLGTALAQAEHQTAQLREENTVFREQLAASHTETKVTEDGTLEVNGAAVRLRHIAGCEFEVTVSPPGAAGGSVLQMLIPLSQPE